MMKQALDAFVKKMRTSFPEISGVLRSWPGPETQAEFPYFVLLVVTAELDKWQPFHLGDGRWHTGQWEVRLDLHHLSQDGDDDNQIQVSEKFASFFDGDVVTDGHTSLDLHYGPAEQNNVANFRLLAFNFENQPHAISKGERRTIFNLEADIPQISTLKTVPIKRIDTDIKVSEDLTLTGNSS